MSASVQGTERTGAFESTAVFAYRSRLLVPTCLCREWLAPRRRVGATTDPPGRFGRQPPRWRWRGQAKGSALHDVRKMTRLTKGPSTSRIDRPGERRQIAVRFERYTDSLRARCVCLHSLLTSQSSPGATRLYRTSRLEVSACQEFC